MCLVAAAIAVLHSSSSGAVLKLVLVARASAGLS